MMTVPLSIPVVAAADEAVTEKKLKIMFGSNIASSLTAAWEYS